MLPDDLFRSRLQTTITALKYWAPSITDSARVKENETGNDWTITVTPFLANACSFELILRFDQLYDVAVADQVYEELPIESFDVFLPFVQAISDGNVVERHWLSRLTGLERAVETVVMLPNDGIWREVQGTVPSRPTLEDDGTELRERRFLAYRRE